MFRSFISPSQTLRPTLSHWEGENGSSRFQYSKATYEKAWARDLRSNYGSFADFKEWKIKRAKHELLEVISVRSIEMEPGTAFFEEVLATVLSLPADCAKNSLL